MWLVDIVGVFSSLFMIHIIKVLKQYPFENEKVLTFFAKCHASDNKLIINPSASEIVSFAYRIFPC